jgi:hypothetical protein
MDHRLVSGLEKAFAWDGPSGLGTTFAHGHLEDTGLPGRLLTPARLLDIIMRRSLSAPQFRCFQDGSELHPGRYFADEIGRRGQLIRMADMPKLGELLRGGCTAILDEVEFFDATMEVACRALQWWSRELVQVNAYLTTQDTAGFAMHWDDHDVVVLQLAGDKAWEVRELTRPAPMYRDAQPNTEPSDQVIWSGTMTPGDMMHIPRGYWHKATRTGQGAGFSLHATFGFVKRTGVDWLSWLADQSRATELFRHDLDRRDGHDQQLALAEAVSQLARTRTADDYLASREAQRPPARHIPATGIFGKPEIIVCILDWPPRITDNGEATEVIAAGKRLSFSSRALPAIRLLLSGVPVNLAEASTATGVDAHRLAGVLMREGLCAELTPELCSGYTGLVANGSFWKAP